MALFGSKKKTDTDATAPVAPVVGAPTVTNGTAPPAAAPVVKEKKARPSKGAVKNGSIVGLNIGNALIKAVEVTAKNGQVSITRLASVPTPPDAYQNGVVLSVSALSNAIKALWKLGGFKGKAVISSVAGTGSLVVRVIEVPLMTDAQLADAMRADAQLYIPFPPTEVQMDFKALRELPTDPDAGTMDVLLAAAQSEIIDAHIKTLQSAKLDPRSIDVEPIAVGRTLALQKRGDFNGLMVDYNEITAVVNIGAMGTEISLLRGDALVFTRSVSTGGNTISQAIADALGVPLVEGERIKVEQGDALPPEGYQSGQGGDDFGFGTQNAGFDSDFDDFGLSDTPAPSGGTNRTTVLDTPPPASPSADPFDLDFFNQGPKDEPGAGHSQKEGEPNPQGGSGGFSFDAFDDSGLLPTPEEPSGTTPVSPNAPTPPAAAGGVSPAFNFDFDMSSSDLPSSAPVPPVAPATSAPSSPPPGFDFNSDAELPDDFLPSIDAPASPPTASASTPMASAFDFSDFDLPATGSSALSPVAGVEPIAPIAPVPSATPTQADSFSFGEIEDEPLVTAAPPATPALPIEPEVPIHNELDFGDLGIPVEETSLVGGVTNTPRATSALGGLDDSDIFVAPAVSETSVQPDQNEGVSFDSLDLGTPGLDLGKPGDTGGLNLGGAGEDPFGFGAGGEDFGGFGAGLSAGPEAEGSAIYDALANAIEELASEISRSLSFYLERVPDAALSRIYLTGGGALLKNLDVFLTGRLGAPTAVLNPLQLLPVTTQSELPNGPLYTVSLGLALRDFVD